MSLTYGSLFAGYGGLEMGVRSVLGGELSWFAEFDKAPSAIMAHHHPDVPNLGDVTKVDWAAVEPVDIITGGSPCQDLSHAGKRAGMKAGTRSGLWASMCDAIDIIRPRLVVWENVRGALSAEADSALEPCAGCVGDGDDGPVLRALGRVLGDLAELGYDANWYGLRAADVGAPHGRFRIFLFATPADAGGLGWGEGASGWAGPGTPTREGQAGRVGGHPLLGANGTLTLLPTPRTSDTNGAGHHGQGGPDLRTVAALLPTPTTTQRGTDANLDTREGARANLHNEVAKLLPTPTAADHKASGGSSPSDVTLTDAVVRTDLGRVPNPRLLPTPNASDWKGPNHSGSDAQSSNGLSTISERLETQQDWREYEPAIRRWEALTRPAPPPTEPGAKGQPRLSPAFVEWLMGLPADHVTDPAIGISRNDQLKALGNGVVWQQAAAATRAFIHDIESERAA